MRPFIRCQAIWCVAFVVGPGLPAFAHQNTGASTTQEVVDAVVAGLQSNDDALGDMKASVHIAIEQPNTPAETTTAKMPGGGTMTMTRSPRFELNGVCILKGPRIRYELLNPDGTALDLLIYDGESWLQFVPEGKNAWRRRPNEMSTGIGPVDPRNYGLDGIVQTLRGVLRDQPITLAELTKDSNGAEIARIAVPTTQGKSYVFDFLAFRSFLPSRILLYLESGDLSNVTEIEHQRIESRGAWFPAKATSLTFIPGIKDPASTSWRTKQIRTVTDATPLSDAQARDALAFELPEGTTVHDNLTVTVSRVGPKPKATGALWLLVGGGALAVVAALVLGFRVWSSKRA